jgi:hypothetical protein
LLVMFPIHWIVLLGASINSDDDGSFGPFDLPPETLETLATALIVPMTIIYVASTVAPVRKLEVAATLGVLWALLLGSAVTLAAQSGNYRDSADWIEFAAAATLGVGGVLGGLFAVYNETESARGESEAAPGITSRGADHSVT